MSRKLASIQRVVSVEAINGADNIELIRVLGWQCVAKKGEFKPGDLCVYFEIDSKLPARPEFEFMAPRGYRVRTIKLRGCISQGLALPPDAVGLAGVALKEGDDVSSQLGVVKYCKGYCGSRPHIVRRRPGRIATLWNRLLVWLGFRDPGRDSFPDFIRKTDETRIQSMPAFLEKYRGRPFYVTEKLDGCSVTAFVKDGRFGLCFRNTLVSRERKYNDLRRFFYPTMERLGIEKWMRSLGRNIAIQGELVGPEIQGNKYKLSEHKWFVFNVYDLDAKQYVDIAHAFAEVAASPVNWCPMIELPMVLDHSVDELVALSKGVSKLAPVQREGFVIRACEEGFDPNFGRLSFKVINPNFLLKYEEDDDSDADEADERVPAEA